MIDIIVAEPPIIITIDNTDNNVLIDNIADPPELITLERLTTVFDTSTNIVELVKVGIQGLRGPSGAAGANSTNEYLAGNTLSALRIVATDKTTGKLVYADSDDTAFAYSVLGMTLESATIDNAINVMFEGQYQDTGWSWDMTGAVSLFVGANGIITQTPPSSGFSLRIGFATASDSIFIQLGQPIILN